ncbi:hypothetical protein [Streptomyces sp. t39]|uniref:hypothetical protein n=1 Tax=Streptomyces sp. t39 TaxID=1828156 RepID=UPI0011CE514F|nr:hypothetical protein [Streptomyces sp. t39]TXS56690.1 hypothetical protein EAO77_11670 [Streptomyces sp. t39]
MNSVARQVAGLLDGRRVRDVLVPGWIDRDEQIVEFRPQPLVVWLRLDLGVVRLSAEEQFGSLGVRSGSTPDWSDVPLLAESEYEIALASWSEQLFGDGRGDLAWTGLRSYETDDGHTTVMALDLEGDHTLFVDPTWTFGIRVGNAADERTWVELYGGDRAPRAWWPAASGVAQRPGGAGG